MIGRDTPLWLLAPPFLALTAVVASPAPSRLYSALLSTAAYALMQYLLPECRFSRELYLCPLNWAMILFFLKLVVMPLILMFDHPAIGVLSALPARTSIEGAVLVDTAAYVSFCIAIRFMPARGRSGFLGSVSRMLEPMPSLRLAAVYALVGALGFAATFGSIGTIRAYFVDPSILPEMAQQMAGTWRSLGGTVLRPFLAFSLILWWCRGIDLHAGTWGPTRQALAGIAAGCGIVAANLTFSFNRASFLFPLVSLTAVFIAKIRRISPVTLGLLGVFAVAPLLAVGAYRAGTRPANEVFQDRSVLSASDLSEEFQVYACAPQFLGYFLEQTGWGKTLYWGSTLIGSALHPVPLLGKGFRDSSGVAIYNRAIYGDTGTEDQIVPFQGELFVNFHLAGVMAGYFALGIVIGEFQRRFESAGSAFAAFSIHYISLWVAILIIWSLAVLSQILVFFCWPIYVYVAWNWIKQWAANERRLPAGMPAPSAAPRRATGEWA